MCSKALLEDSSSVSEHCGMVQTDASEQLIRDLLPHCCNLLFIVWCYRAIFNCFGISDILLISLQAVLWWVSACRLQVLEQGID